jgi:hypothetical protein
VQIATTQGPRAARLHARPGGTADAASWRMSDLIYVLVTIAFFAAGLAYAHGCERL